MLLSMTTIAQIAVHGQVTASGGQVRPVLNVFTYDAYGSILYPGTTKANLATRFRASVWAHFFPVLHTDYTGVDIGVWFPSSTGDVYQLTGIVPQNGTRTGARLPISSAVYVGVRSGLRGIWYRGSKRLAPISESDVVSDELTAPAQAAFQTAVNFCAFAFSTGAGPTFILWHPVVWSQTISTPPPDVNSQVGADVISAHPNLTISTWRHRRERTVR